MARTRETLQIFSTSFLDLLSCAMGALVLVALVFAAGKKSRAEVQGETTVIILRATQSPSPQLGIRLHIKGESLSPGDTPSNSSKVRLIVDPEIPQSSAYTLMITGEDFHPNDRLEVYVADLGESQETRVQVRTEYLAGTADSANLQLNLKSPGGPIQSLPVQGLGKPGFSFVWRDVP